MVAGEKRLDLLDQVALAVGRRQPQATSIQIAMDRGCAAEDGRKSGGTEVHHERWPDIPRLTGIPDQRAGAKDQPRSRMIQDGPPEVPERPPGVVAYAFSHVQMPSGVKVSDSITLV